MGTTQVFSDRDFRDAFGTGYVYAPYVPERVIEFFTICCEAPIPTATRHDEVHICPECGEGAEIFRASHPPAGPGLDHVEHRWLLEYAPELSRAERGTIVAMSPEERDQLIEDW